MTELPSMNSLKKEYTTIAAERKRLYIGYHEMKDSNRALAVAVANAERIIGISQDAHNRDVSRADEH
jgi:hypothetical protein